MTQPQLLDTVALLNDLPIDRLTLVEPAYAAISVLPSGLIGTIVEVYEQEQDQLYRVEFSDRDGCEYALAILKPTEILVLRSELVAS